MSMMVVEPPVGASIGSLCGVPTPRDAIVLASSQQVNAAIARLAEQIAPWMARSGAETVTLVGLLEGGRFFADRLAQQMQGRGVSGFSRVDLKVSTRDGDGRPLDEPSIKGDVEALRGRRVLVVDDILDSGKTLEITYARLHAQCAEMCSAVLVQKNEPSMELGNDRRPKPDYVGLVYSDTRWFSGAGMDMPGDPEGRARGSATIIAYPPVF